MTLMTNSKKAKPFTYNNLILCHLLQFPRKGMNIQKRPQLAFMKPRNFQSLSKRKWFVSILGGSLEKYPKCNLMVNIWLQLWDLHLSDLQSKRVGENPRIFGSRLKTKVH